MSSTGGIALRAPWLVPRYHRVVTLTGVLCWLAPYVDINGNPTEVPTSITIRYLLQGTYRVLLLVPLYPGNTGDLTPLRVPCGTLVS